MANYFDQFDEPQMSDVKRTPEGYPYRQAEAKKNYFDQFDEPQTGRAEAAGRGVLSGATFGFWPRLSALAGAAGYAEAQPLSLGLLPKEDVMQLYEMKRRHETEQQKAAREQHPGYYGVGEFAGSAALPLPGISSLMAPGRAIGSRIAGGALQGAIAGGVSGAGEAETPAEMIPAGVRGGVLGGVTGGVVGPVASTLTKYLPGPRTTAEQIFDALRRRGVGPGPKQLRAGEAPAGVLPIDIAGAPGREIAKWAANVSPEAAETLTTALTERTAGQAERLRDFITTRFGAGDNDLNRLAIRAQQKEESTPAYTQAMWLGNNLPALPMFDALKRAPAVQAAMRGAAESLQNRLIAQGGASRYETHPNSLAFWDQVKRGLDSRIGVAARSGDRELVGELAPLKQKLVEALDTMVPAYRNARATWMAFQGADNAIEAGEKFVNSKMTSAEAARALQAMSPEQQEAWGGAARNAFLAKMENVADTHNLWNRIAQSRPQAQKLGLVFGRDGMNELEAMKRAESVFHLAQTRVQGGSDTARNLITNLMIGGAPGAYDIYQRGREALTDPTTALTGLALGAARAGKRAYIDPRVANHLAGMLVSGDPQMLQRAATIAARNPTVMDVLRRVNEGLTRGTAMQAEQRSPQ
jgi:hypothetical protein